MDRQIAKINLGVVLDRSGSVEAEKIPIENGISLLIEAYKRKYADNFQLDIEVCIVGEDDIHLPSTVEESIKLKKLVYENEDIIDILNKISEDFSKEKIILFSDGYFNNDNYKEQWRSSQEVLKSVEIYAIGIGEGYNKYNLKFLSDNKVYEIEDIYDLV
ncbi:MAG: VWA domain-containing protein [Cetobacterium sp.]